MMLNADPLGGGGDVGVVDVVAIVGDESLP